MKQAKKRYMPSFGEEVANTISHGIMAIIMLIALPFAALWSYTHATSNPIVTTIGVTIFIVSIFLMFLASTLYHAMSPQSKHKAIFQILDHIFIYVAIAGTYTPIALSVIGGWQGIAIVVVQWLMVLFGIFYKSLSKRSMPAISLTIYLIMGWTILLFFPLFIRHASTPLLILIAAGGVLYTIGAWFYARKGFKYHHLVWHLLIDAAVICHSAAILFFLY